MATDLKIIDLYSGVGGLSLGAVKAGFDLAGAVEIEKRIIDSHTVNFPKSQHLCSDVSSLNSKTLKKELKLGNRDLSGLIGGPPCQGFSTMGKRCITDERNQLFVNFFKLTTELQPAFFLAENVPGILNDQYSKIRNKGFRLVENDYQLLKPIKVVASDFGAATIRTRIFFIGVRNDIAGAELIPEAIEQLKSNAYSYVKDALLGLPEKISDTWLDYNSSWQQIETSNPNNYVKKLNQFVEGIGEEVSIKRFLKKKEVSGCFGTRHSTEIAKRYSKLKPGQQDLISKSSKLNVDGFCPTLRAGTDSTKGSFQAVRPIHPTQPRVITPREAARLQGFPDWFQFHETKWHSFRQIGNSVCPIAAEKVLLAIKQSIKM